MFDDNLKLVWKQAILTILCTTLTFLLVMYIFASDKREYYYVVHDASSTTISAYCLYASINWRPDSRVYCSENFPQVLMLSAAMNAQNNTTSQRESLPPKKNSLLKEESF